MPNKVVWTFLARDKFSAHAKRMKNRVSLLKQEFKQLNSVAKRSSAALKKLGQSMKKMSLVATAAIVGSLKAFSDMQKGVTNVLTLMDDKEVNKFGGAIEKLATQSLTKFGFNTEETTQALFNNVSALGANEKSFEAFDAAQRLAIGGVTSLDTAVSGIAAVMNAYGDAASDSTAVANAFFAAQKKGTTDVTELANNIGKVAPTAKAAGVGYQELLATMAQLTQGGLSMEESSTSLKGVISSLLKPTTAAKRILDRYGVSYGATALRGQKFTETLAQINKLSADNPDLLAEAIPNIRAFTAAAALGTKELGRIDEIVGSMQTDQLTAAFNKQMETFSRSTSKLKGQFVAIGITIGSNLAPAFLWLANKLEIVANWFQGLSDNTKKWISWGLVVVAVLSSIFIVAAAAVAFFGTAFAVVATAMGTLVGAIFSIPFAIAAAIVAAGIAIFAWWDEIKGIAGKVASFFGFGDDTSLDANLNSSADVTNSSRLDGEIRVVAEKGTSASVRSKTSGSKNANVGMNMEGATG